MKNVRWTNNVCTVGGTCIHGYFTLDDLRQLFKLCPDASFTPTFYHEKLGAYGYSEQHLDKVKEIGEAEAKRRRCMYPLHTHEWGYYFTFMEKDGQALIKWLKERYPMRRGEDCY
jgi:hypothetical protein